MTQTAEQERDWWDAADPTTNVWGVGTWAEGIAVCIDAIVPALELDAHARILDLGVGVGRLAIPIAEGHPLATVWGVDVSDNMATRCRNAAGGRVWALQCDGRTVPMVDEFFHAAYSVAMFQHLPHDATRGYLADVARVLLPGGRFRFQHVIGTEDSFLSHQVADTATLREWCIAAGLEVAAIDAGLIHHQWVWVTAVKP